MDFFGLYKIQMCEPDNKHDTTQLKTQVNRKANLQKLIRTNLNKLYIIVYV